MSGNKKNFKKVRGCEFTANMKDDGQIEVDSFSGTLGENVESVCLNKDKNQIEVVMREPSNMMLMSNPPQSHPDKVWKNIFAVDYDGEIYLKEKIVGKITPAKYVNEKIDFDDE